MHYNHPQYGMFNVWMAGLELYNLNRPPIAIRRDLDMIEQGLGYTFTKAAHDRFIYMNKVNWVNVCLYIKEDGYEITGQKAGDRLSELSHYAHTKLERTLLPDIQAYCFRNASYIKSVIRKIYLNDAELKLTSVINALDEHKEGYKPVLQIGVEDRE